MPCKNSLPQFKYLTIWRNFAAVQAITSSARRIMRLFSVDWLGIWACSWRLINYLLAPYLDPEILSMMSDYRA